MRRKGTIMTSRALDLGRISLLSAVAVFLAAFAGRAYGQDDTAKKLTELQGQLAEMRARIDQLTQQKVSREEMMQLMEKWNADSAKRASALPKWAENLKFSGDLRLRAEALCYNWGDSPGADHRPDRNRARFRLRFGLVKTWLDDQLEVGFRLASGSSNDPTTTNQTLGENSSAEPAFAKRPVWIDLAWAKYSPKDLKGFSIAAGKMANPMILNEIFLDTDVNPEGAWAEYKVPNLGNLEPFAGAGYFILKEVGSAPRDANYSGGDVDLWACQAGLGYKITPDVKYTVGGLFLQYNDYRNSQGNTSNSGTKGNDRPLSLVGDFRVIDVTNKLEFKAFDLPASVFFDWAHNCGNKDSNPHYDDKDNALATGITLGRNKKAGDWSLKYLYGYIQPNSLPGALVDADIGSANRKGHLWGGAYNITDDLTVGVWLYYTKPIHSDTNTVNGVASEGTTTSVRGDLVWRF
jgi:hypothetical protein